MDLISLDNSRIFSLWTGLLFILFSFTVVAETPPPTSGIVISIQGDVFERKVEGQEWELVKSGSEFTKNSILNIQPDSQVKILTDHGQMIKLAEPGHVRFSMVLSNQSPHFGFLETLKVLFSIKERRKIPSVRDLDQSYQEWIKLLSREDPRQLDLEALFELMALYSELNYKNRILSLLNVLTRTYPNNPIYFRLNQSLRKKINSNVTWDMILNGERIKVSEKKIPIQFNDHIQVVYHAQLESYLYLFLSSHSEKQDPKTMALFPMVDESDSYSAAEFGLQSRINPGSGLILPASDRAYKVDQNKGHEIIWGWSCHEPILNKTVLQNQKKLMEQAIKKQKPLSMNHFGLDNPTGCHSFLLQRFDHH